MTWIPLAERYKQLSLVLGKRCNSFALLRKKKKGKKKTSPSNNEPASTNHDCAFSRDFVGNETSLHSAEKGTEFKQGSHDTV